MIRHSFGITAARFSPDGVRVLSGSEDGTLKLWIAATGQLVRTFEGHSGAVSSVAFSADGMRLVSGGTDKSLKLWDSATGQVMRTLTGHSQEVWSVAFSPNGSRILSCGSDKTVRLWDADSGRLLRTFLGHADAVLSVAFTPDETRALSGGRDNTLKLWDVTTGKLLRTLSGHMGWVTAVAVSPDGMHALSGSWDKTVKLWDVGTGRILWSNSAHSGVVTSVAFSAGGTRVLSGGRDKVLKLWDAANGALLRSFEGHSDRVDSVAFGPDPSQVLSGSGDTTLKLWDVTSGRVIRAIQGRSDAVTSLAFSPDGTRLLSGSDDHTLKIWNTLTGELQRVLEKHSDEVWSVAFSPDGKRVLSGGADKSVMLWDGVTGQALRTLQGHGGQITSVALSPDGARALSGSWDKTLKLWDVATGNLLRTFAGHAGEVNAVAFSPDGNRVLSGSTDHSLKLWDVATGQGLRTFSGHTQNVNAIAFSSDGTRVLSGSSDKTLRLWNARTGKVIWTANGHSSVITSVAFLPDGTRVISGSADRTLKFWDASTGRLLSTLVGHSGVVDAVAFSPDGSRVASASLDGTIRIWSGVKGDLRATLFANPSGEALAITPSGFFRTSGKGAQMVSVVRGLEAFSVTQFFDHLYRPDLVEEVFKGDPEGKYKDAAFKLNLEKILDSGPAPQIDHLGKKTERAGNTVRLAVRLVDTGGGIGPRIVWRVNGKTSGNVAPEELKGVAAPSVGRAVSLTETFRVDPGQVNVIGITAYNGAGLIATPPFQITIDELGATTEESPRMHVLAIGVNKYRMKDYELRLAVKDATDLAKALEMVGSGLFAKVKVETLTDEQVTEANIAAAFARIGADAKPWDIFVLFLGGHGKSIAGRYYYYPQTLDFAAGQAVEGYGLGQDQWQAWLARIDAQKKLLILDTCESGAAARLVRGSDSVRQTAMDQLQHATGENLIAASRVAAYEGYQGHGVLTYALLEALNKTDGSADDPVRVGSMADYVDARVPAISQQLFGIYQKPIRALSGNDFPIGIRQAVLTTNGEATIPKTPTHVLIRTELVRESAAEDAPSERQLPPGSQVRVVEFTGAWAMIARDGQRLGYVLAAALAPLQ